MHIFQLAKAFGLIGGHIDLRLAAYAVHRADDADSKLVCHARSSLLYSVNVQNDVL